MQVKNSYNNFFIPTNYKMGVRYTDVGKKNVKKLAKNAMSGGQKIVYREKMIKPNGAKVQIVTRYGLDKQEQITSIIKPTGKTLTASKVDYYGKKFTFDISKEIPKKRKNMSWKTINKTNWVVEQPNRTFSKGIKGFLEHAVLSLGNNVNELERKGLGNISGKIFNLIRKA